MPGPDFALNHMVAPRKSLPAFMDMARSLGVEKIEIRNDLSGQAITDGTSARDRQGRRRIEESLHRQHQRPAALQPVDLRPGPRKRRKLIAYAKACGAEALVLCPVNDESFAPAEQSGSRACARR